MTHTILFDLTPLDTPSRYRGIGRYVRQLAVGLSRIGAGGFGDLRVVGLTHLKKTGKFALTEDLAAFAGSPDVPWPTPSDHYRFTYARRLALFRAVRRIGAGVVHLGDPNATPLFMGLAKCKRIVTCHDVIGLLFPRRYLTYRDGGPWVGRQIARRRYRSADLVVAISDATRRDVVELAGVAETRVVRVYNGIDCTAWMRTEEHDHAAVAHRYGLGSAFVIYAGRADWRKNTEGMMGAIRWARSNGLLLDLAWAGKLSAGEAQHGVRTPCCRPGPWCRRRRRRPPARLRARR
jgi:glycosyltransferase involved in cell wall biosynthesis